MDGVFRLSAALHAHEMPSWTCWLVCHTCKRSPHPLHSSIDRASLLCGLLLRPTTIAPESTNLLLASVQSLKPAG